MQSFFNGMSGMFNFSKMLDNVSNNISNMNTPGYKGSDMFIRSITDGDSNLGAAVTSTAIRTQTGDIRQTSNTTDLAINGDGYFVLKNKAGDIFYTRAGQFRFDENNKLIDSASGYSVMAVNSSNQLQQIDVSNNKLLPPVPTTTINLVGNLSQNDSTFTVNNIAVFDASGTSQLLSATFTNAGSNTWNVSLTNSGATQVASFQIQFAIDSSPATGFNSITKAITLGSSSQNITFNMGATGTLTGATQSSGRSDLAVTVKDGHAALGLRTLAIDEKGIIQFTYSDSETISGQQVALANFSDPSTLQPASKGLFKSTAIKPPAYGKPNSGNFGSIQSKSIEMSNVDLTQEFADILIIQRGYQASSRVMSVSNDLLDQLFNNTRTK